MSVGIFHRHFHLQGLVGLRLGVQGMQGRVLLGTLRQHFFTSPWINLGVYDFILFFGLSIPLAINLRPVHNQEFRAFVQQRL